MLASVVKSLPATRSMTRRPLRASRRNPAAVMVPSGKAIAAAMLSRSGAPGSRSSRCGILRITGLAVELVDQTYAFTAAVDPVVVERILLIEVGSNAKEEKASAGAIGDGINRPQHIFHTDG